MAVSLKAARDFVYANGVLWEQALFAYLFQGTDVARLHQCLLCYKNTDNGYGHALEHDIRCPDSHPLSLEFLLGVLVQLDIPIGPLLDGTAAWVARCQQPDGSLLNPPAVLDYPHAPWWNGGGQSQPDSIVGNLERLGYADQRLRENTAAWVRENLTLDKIRQNEWLFMAYHAYDYFASADTFPDRDSHWQATIDNIIACAAQAEPKQYYALLHFAPTADALVARAMPAELLTRYLDQLEAVQADDGGWHDEHGLPQWRAYTTIQTLRGLQQHGRDIGTL